MTVQEMRNALNRLIINGYANFKVMMMHPVYANDYYKRKINEIPLTTVEEIINKVDYVELLW